MTPAMRAALHALPHDQWLRSVDVIGHLALDGGPRATAWAALRAAVTTPIDDQMPHPRLVSIAAQLDETGLGAWVDALAGLAQSAATPAERRVIQACAVELGCAVELVEYAHKALAAELARMEGTP